MPATIGVNLRVTGHNSQGGRKYMEDRFSVAYQQTEDEKDLEYAFFGIYDGHGGGEAATYAKEHLMDSIVRQQSFWSDKDDEVLRAIKEGYIATHYAMWKEQANWPKTASGLPSTAGTTATVAFIRHAKIYIGHVGDSGVILGYQEPGEIAWKAKPLTKDHKPENAAEMSRIHQCGGKVITKSGVPRVVWNRPRIGHKGPVRRSTPIDEIPFLAVARSLGDLWSYNSARDTFIVSPKPDTCVIPIDTNTFRCLIFGTDGLWNMMSPDTAVHIVQTTELHNERLVFATNPKCKVWINPSKSLVEYSLERWSNTKIRADNTTAVTLLLDPPGPPRAEVLMNQRKESIEQNTSQNNPDLYEPNSTFPNSDVREPYPTNGLAIVTRYPSDRCGKPDPPTTVFTSISPQNTMSTNNPTSVDPQLPPQPHTSTPTNCNQPANSAEETRRLNESPDISFMQTSLDSSKWIPETPSSNGIECGVKTPETPTSSEVPTLPLISKKPDEEVVNIQINEVSSSSPEELPTTSEIKDTSYIERFSKRINRLNVLKTKPKLLLPIGRCTRSHDTMKSVASADKRIRAVTSSSDISKLTDVSEPRKHYKVVRRTIIVGDEFRRNTRAMDRKGSFKAKGEYANKILTKDHIARKRLIGIGIDKKDTSNVLAARHTDRVLFPSEPQTKKRDLHKLETSVSARVCDQRFRHGEVDGAGSDQENNYKKLRSLSFPENTLNAHPLRRLRTRPRLSDPVVSCSTPKENIELPVSSSKTNLLGRSERNLRERNVITQATEIPSAFRLRSGADKMNSRISSSSKFNKAVAVIKRHTVTQPVALRRTLTRNTWSKATVQTRNRVKKFKK